jgi:hypothetical protein
MSRPEDLGEAEMAGVVCGQCGVRLKAEAYPPGRRIGCKRCGGVTVVPGAPLETAPAAFSPAPVAENVFKPARPRSKPKRRFPNREPWLSLVIGAALAIVARMVPIIAMVPAVLQTVVHELGHVGTDWVTGVASVPGFDLVNGGGFARGFGQLPGLLVIIYALSAYVIFKLRTRPWLLAACLIAVPLHALITFTRWRDFTSIVMGHGLEVIIAGVFLYRALSGVQILRAIERPLYAFLGIFFLIGAFKFGYGLRNDLEMREDYETETRDGIHHDFVRAANDFLHVPLETVAGWYLVLCVLTPLLAYTAYRLRLRTRS